jgi:hypothetical protein
MKTINATAVRTFPAPTLGPRFTITIKAEVYQLNGNEHPHFSVTGEVRNPKRRDDCEMWGCLHTEAARYWPAVKPIIDLHLSNADDGEPMHAEANGFYWLTGAVPEHNHFGERYHGGNSQRQHWKPYGEFDGYRFSIPDECLATLADHLRITRVQAHQLRDDCVAEYSRVIEAGRSRTDKFTWEQLQKHAAKAARSCFASFVETQRERWRTEAEKGVALIRELSCEEQAAALEDA